MPSISRPVAALFLSALCLTFASCGESASSSSSEEATGGGGITGGYPPAVAQRFVQSCALNAKLSSSGKLTPEEARDLCIDALTCVEQGLTISELRETERKLLSGEPNPGARVLRGCTEKAIEQHAG
ncbi:MAG TPA: hypothetical protein VNO20_01135 [Solirubrobacterales bacterium]|nr:hypothetical protein [Solirubrobacterales bacterium]